MQQYILNINNKDVEVFMTEEQYETVKYIFKKADVKYEVKENKQVNYNEEFKRNMAVEGYPTIVHDTKCDVSMIDDKKVTVFGEKMGAGKTTSVLKYIKKNQGKSVLYVTANRSLAKNILGICHFIPEIDITHDVYNPDMKHYVENENVMKHTDRLICQVQSLHKIEREKYDIVVIDEYLTVLKIFMSDTTHNGKYQQNYNAFSSFLNKAKKVIVMDAFITKSSLHFLQKICKLNKEDFTVYQSIINGVYTRRLKETDLKYNGVIEKMIKDINDGKKLFIFYGYCEGNKKLGIRELHQYITDKTGKKGCIYYGDQDDDVKQQLKNVNDNWSGDTKFVITTSCITVGVNYELDDYDKIYLFVSSVNDARSVIQTSMRLRNIKDNEMELCYLDKYRGRDFIYPVIYQKNIIKKLNHMLNQLYYEAKADFKESMKTFCYYSDFEFIEYKGDVKKSKYIIDRDTKRFTKNFEDIYTIRTEDEYNFVRGNVVRGCATEDEKLAVEKYLFNKKLRYLPEKDREELYNNYYKSDIPFLALNKDEKIYSPIIKNIMSENNLNPEDMRSLCKLKFTEKLTISSGTIELINHSTSIEVFDDKVVDKVLDEKKESKKIYAKLLISKALNTVLGLNIVESSYDKASKVSTRKINTELFEKFMKWQDMIDKKETNYFDDEVIDFIDEEDVKENDENVVKDVYDETIEAICDEFPEIVIPSNVLPPEIFKENDEFPEIVIPSNFLPPEFFDA